MLDLLPYHIQSEVVGVVEFARLDIKGWQMAAFATAAVLLWRAEQVSHVKSVLMFKKFSEQICTG